MVKILNKQSRSLKDQKNQLAQTGHGTRSRQDQGKHKSLLCKPRSQVEIGGQAFSHWPAEVTGTLKHGWNPCKVCFLTQERQVHSHPTTTPVLFQRIRHFLIFSLKQKYPVRKKKSPNKKIKTRGSYPGHATQLLPKHTPLLSVYSQLELPLHIHLLPPFTYKLICHLRSICWLCPLHPQHLK